MGADRSRSIASIIVMVGVLAPSITVGGCSLFTSLDGLSDGSDPSDSSTCANCDSGSGSDGNVGSDGSAPGDGSTKIDDSGNAPDRFIPPGAFICGTGSVGDCSACAGNHQPCMTCSNSGTPSPLFCAKSGDNCRDDLPPGLSTFSSGCNCSGGASMCPEAFQVCHNSQFCHTCGEPMSTGEPCQEGGTCAGNTCN